MGQMTHAHWKLILYHIEKSLTPGGTGSDIQENSFGISILLKKERNQ